jgi:phosphatidylserine/phosphatidylglycerophosphate/cardiolipin synthase-like enzyme
MRLSRIGALLLLILLATLFTNVTGQGLVLEKQGHDALMLVSQNTNVVLESVTCMECSELALTYRVEEGQIDIENLEAGHIYKVTYRSNDELFVEYFATKSNSTGDIKVYFNYPIPFWPESKLNADGSTFGEVEKAIKDLIRSATSTIDYCAYNTNVSSIANELIDATARGVQVRVIVEADNNNFAFSGGVPFPILEDWNPNLMHNKFIVVDADSDDPDKPFVVNGSMNFTQGQMAADPNHLMIIQDQSLARTYQMEFEEMWGSDGPDYDLSNARFGSEKEDNTPHQFTIGDICSELYFSPSDRTSERMINTLETANHEIDLGLLIFTYWDLRDQLLTSLQDGVRIRGIVEDDDNSSAVVSQLNSHGANIKYHGANAIYHHKMAIIDAEYENSDPSLISGSHNWTYTAETANDENTMIFKDAGLAELFKRAFSHYWVTLTTSTTDAAPEEIRVLPNPTADIIAIDMPQGLEGEIMIFDGMGKVIITSSIQNILDVSKLAQGTYFIVIKAKGNLYFSKFVKV